MKRFPRWTEVQLPPAEAGGSHPIAVMPPSLLCYCCDRPPWGAPASGPGLRKMPQQSNLFSSSPRSGSTVQERQAAPQRPSRVPLWLRRVELYLYVIIRIYIGVIVLVLPWYAPLWADNQLLNYFPRLGTFLMYGAVRGVVSGLG